MKSEHEESARLATLREYRILDTPGEAEFDAITAWARRLFAVPVALVSLIDKDRQWFKSHAGIDADQAPRADAFCHYAIRQSEAVMVVPDTLQDPRFKDNPHVTGPQSLRFYAGAPLVTPKGYALGTLCLIDRKPRVFTPHDQELLRFLAEQVMQCLEYRRVRNDLEEMETVYTQTEELQRTMLTDVSEGLMVFDLKTQRVVQASSSAYEILGYSPPRLIGLRKEKVIDTHDERWARLVRKRQRHRAATAAIAMLTASGQRIQVYATSSLVDLTLAEEPALAGREAGETATSLLPRAGATGRQGLATLLFRETGDGDELTTSLTHELMRQANLMRHLAERVPGTIYQYRLFPDGRACFPYASEGIRDIYEVSPEDVREDASVVFSRLHPDDLASVAQTIADSAVSLRLWTDEYRVLLPRQGLCWRRGEAKPERLADGSTLWHGYIQDITGRKKQEELAFALMNNDPLTGLANRTAMNAKLEQLVASAQRHGSMGAVCFIDLDRFKQINDARGHPVGDKVLIQVAERIRGSVRAEDVTARLGGDEFVVILPNLSSSSVRALRQANGVLEKIRDELDQPYTIDGTVYSISASFGVALYPDADARLEDYIRYADTAMYKAKAAGGNRVRFFAENMKKEVEEQVRLEQDLRLSLGAQQLYVDIQPQYSAGPQPTGGELLVRWRHPQHGIVPPATFIPIAEESGFIKPVGIWVVEQACLTLQRLPQVPDDFTLSVNVSVHQLSDDAFVHQVLELIERHGCPPRRLTLEVTESVFAGDMDAVRKRLTTLAEAGLRISIDDFGTGFSSLSYLQRLPIDEIKIDRSFVEGIPDDPGSTAIASLIVSMAQSLKLEVVAEGVESAAQEEFLLGRGVQKIQGYLRSRPVGVDAFVALCG